MQDQRAGDSAADCSSSGPVDPGLARQLSIDGELCFRSAEMLCGSEPQENEMLFERANLRPGAYP